MNRAEVTRALRTHKRSFRSRFTRNPKCRECGQAWECITRTTALASLATRHRGSST